MKEFIEKLIGRLEEIYNRNNKQKKEAYEEQEWERFDFFTHRNEGIYIAMAIVNKLAEEYNNGWIPCSERLPETGRRYLVSCIVKTGDIEEHTVWHAIYAGARGWYTVENKALNTEVKIEVIAWQPLPELYKPQHESKKTTNGERIRKMSDEELAYFLACIREPDEDAIEIDNRYFFDENEILSWLKEESE